MDKSATPIDITAYIIASRSALLIADYNTYRASLSRQILALCKRLGRTTRPREKFAPKPILAADLSRDHAYAHLLLLTAERAWAHAMHMKTTHAEDTAGGRWITGATRGHILSRLAKAGKTASGLVGLLGEAGAGERHLLEGRAYAASLVGAEEFEKLAEGHGEGGKGKWEGCLERFAEARVVYAALYEKEGAEVFKEVLANTVDPTIRYAAYQAGLSRTIAISTVAKKYFPRGDKELVKMVEAVDPYALKDKPAPKTDGGKQDAPQEVPNSVTWRGRKANIVDASIGQALAGVTAAEAKLRSYLTSNPAASNRDKAAAYDDILVASQDAADATKRATYELEKEKVDEGDARMQDLRVTSLSVHYDLVSWRVGRNRVLIGDDDGLSLTPHPQKMPKRPRKDGTPYPPKEESRGHQLARLRERLVLYDATIQSINSIKDLRGAMRDATFVEELEGKANYFRALKCLNIATSHTMLGSHLNALALLNRARDLAAHTAKSQNQASEDSNAPPNLTLPSSLPDTLLTTLTATLTRAHALVELHNLQEKSATAAAKNLTTASPVVQKLNDFPSPGIWTDLGHLVSYPPRVEPVPVKPLFLDVAWNYVEYPGRGGAAEAMGEKSADAGAMEVDAQEEKVPQKKKGWFGFGR